jgi:hypothetical protein
MALLHVGHRHDLDDLDPPAGHHLQVGMCLAEQLRGRVVGLRLDDRIAADAVLRVRGSFGVDALGFAEGPPPSTIDFLFFSIHFIQPSMPFFCCSGVELFIAFSKSALEAMYRTMNFFMLRPPS